MMSNNNPWAWRTLPSSFDDETYADMRFKAVSKRRIQAVINSLLTIKKDTIDDIPQSVREVYFLFTNKLMRLII